ncbi:mitochondrial chaperone BCS1 [Eremomyces bilateralis CBS 781.70]|uniref:Mitochondrial chaperone BCS1 n=1 Tax=Eremomyces bilateralis CBS 781.70 TaxID=1392243 RepID=A0A6G1G4G9_9PEZI|nr:mitochondrial chaperone BCS1 [Eremomyces bilateralis CBS 781.70]KAF1812953.1 mitochondrial chaperone BCS1 [Eremomyces bilateralis CBS 781.70]
MDSNPSPSSSPPPPPPAPSISNPPPNDPITLVNSRFQPLSGKQNATAASQDGSLFAQFAGNPFFTAGFGLAALAAAMRVGQQGVKRGAELLRRRLLVNVEITHSDEAYRWLLNWMTFHQRTQLNEGASKAVGSAEPKGIVASIIRRLTPNLHHLQIQTVRANRADGSIATHFSLVPGQGRHILRYGNAFIAVNRQREKTFDLAKGEPFETVTLTTLWAYRHIFEKLFEEARQLDQQMQEGKTIIYTAWGTEWKPFGEPKRKRPLDSVVLAEGMKERIMDDIQAFLDARTWYLDRGIPYRRGYLLYGPPGTGKSSFIQALAGELDFNIAILNVSERGLTDDRLNHLLTKIPPRTIVLLEDADAAFVNRQQADEHGYAGATVTFSGLLNALDGVASAEERIIFLTTNHVERLDAALVRPGRVDMTVRLGEATEYQIGQLWDRFYEEFDVDKGGKGRFLERVRQLGLVDSVSTAALQGLFLYHKGDMEAAIGSAEELVSHPTAGGETLKESVVH